MGVLATPALRAFLPMRRMRVIPVSGTLTATCHPCTQISDLELAYYQAEHSQAGNVLKVRPQLLAWGCKRAGTWQPGYMPLQRQQQRAWRADVPTPPPTRNCPVIPPSHNPTITVSCNLRPPPHPRALRATCPPRRRCASAHAAGGQRTGCLVFHPAPPPWCVRLHSPCQLAAVRGWGGMQACRCRVGRR